MNRIALFDAAATADLGAKIARLLRAGDAVCLFGDLGAGKSTLARGLIRALTSAGEEVPSPTFTLVQTYNGPAFAIAHFDLYRLTSAAEAYEIGVDEALVNLIDRDRQWTKSTSDGPHGSGNEVPRQDSFCNTAIQHRDGIVVEDALLDDRFRDNVHVTCANPVRFYAGMPIAAPSGP